MSDEDRDGSDDDRDGAGTGRPDRARKPTGPKRPRFPHPEFIPGYIVDKPDE